MTLRIHGLFGVLLGAIVMTACETPAPDTVTTDAVIPVTTAAVEARTVHARVHATGLVTPAPGADLLVVAPEPARIEAVTKAEGERVHRGDVLVRFEIPSLLADESRQHAEVGRAQSRVVNTREAAVRAHDLFDRGVASRKEAEDADRDAAEAQADLQGAQAAAASASTLASRRIVRATFDGVVARRLHNPGDHVEASAADVILRVIDPARLEIVASVPIAEIGHITIGAAAHLADDAGAGELRVISLPVAVDPNTTSVPVRLAMRGRTALPVGAPVSLDIDAESRSAAAAIPRAAVTRDGEDTSVFVVNADKAARRHVTLGVADDTHVEVTAGLRAGELVIVDGQAGLPDGATIARRNEVEKASR